MVVDDRVRDSFKTASRNLRGVGHAAAAGAAGVGFLAGNIVKSAKDRADEWKPAKLKTGEVTMKKSTLVALLLAIGVVVGVLAALYFYVIRRERELDEYEQLLFSEDFSDDLPDTFGDEDLDDSKD